jgi:hypothetical protein
MQPRTEKWKMMLPQPLLPKPSSPLVNAFARLDLEINQPSLLLTSLAQNVALMLLLAPLQLQEKQY